MLALLFLQTCLPASLLTFPIPRRETKRRSVAGQLTVSLDDLRVKAFYFQYHYFVVAKNCL